ncbi:hypothetical protein BGX27_011564 [Mortierella sp. AM989]|nr:hypothetical protein BGX27_011564 [Mortierella sp. AM989]
MSGNSSSSNPKPSPPEVSRDVDLATDENHQEGTATKLLGFEPQTIHTRDAELSNFLVDLPILDSNGDTNNARKECEPTPLLASEAPLPQEQSDFVRNHQTPAFHETINVAIREAIQATIQALLPSAFATAFTTTFATVFAAAFTAALLNYIPIADPAYSQSTLFQGVIQGESHAESSSAAASSRHFEGAATSDSCSTSSTTHRQPKKKIRPNETLRSPYPIRDRFQIMCLQNLSGVEISSEQKIWLANIIGIARTSIYGAFKEENRIISLILRDKGELDRIPKGMPLTLSNDDVDEVNRIRKTIGTWLVEKILSIIFPGQVMSFPECDRTQFVKRLFDYTESVSKAIDAAKDINTTIDRPVGDFIKYATISWSLEKYLPADLYFCVAIDEIWVGLNLDGVIDMRRAFCLYFYNKNGPHDFTTLALVQNPQYPSFEHASSLDISEAYSCFEDLNINKVLKGLHRSNNIQMERKICIVISQDIWNSLSSAGTPPKLDLLKTMVLKEDDYYKHLPLKFVADDFNRVVKNPYRKYPIMWKLHGLTLQLHGYMIQHDDVENSTLSSRLWPPVAKSTESAVDVDPISVLLVVDVTLSDLLRLLVLHPCDLTAVVHVNWSKFRSTSGVGVVMTISSRVANG